jgi:hypothetical protein
LDWPTVRMILTCRSAGRTMSDRDIDAARADYMRLSKSSAQRVLRFWQVRQTVPNEGVPPTVSSPAMSRGSKPQIPIH